MCREKWGEFLTLYFFHIKGLTKEFFEFKVYFMNIVVFGLGAIGIVYAVSLKKSGHRVFGVTKEQYLKFFEDKKFKIKGIFGEKEAVLDGVYRDCNNLVDKGIDLIIVSVKSFDTEPVVRELKKVVRDKTYILLAQNGYGNYEIAAKELGSEHVILGRVIFGSKLIDRNFAEVTVIADDVIIGQPDRAIDESIFDRISKIMCEAGIPTRYSDDVYSILWDKIIYNCALNPLGAILECNYGALASNKYSKEIMNKVIEEIFIVTKANGIKLKWNNHSEYIEHFYSKLIPPTKEHFPSMYYDLKNGKKTEIDALNGAIVRLGNKKSISCFVNEVLWGLIKSKEEFLKEEKSGNF